MERNNDAYFANLYHLTKIKTDTRIAINKRKNDEY